VVSYIRKNSKGRVTVVGGGGYWKNFDYYDATHKSNNLTKKNDYNFALLFSNGNLYRKNFSLSEEKFSDIQIDYASPAFSRSGTFISNEIGSPEYFIEVFSDSQNCYFVVQSYLTEYEVSAGKIICSGSAEVEKGYGVARVISTLIPTKAYYTASGDIVIGRRSLVYTGTGQVLLSGTGGPFEVELIAVASGGIIMGGAALLPTKDSGLYGDVFYGDTYYRNS
jgi:hypothetical protein